MGGRWKAGLGRDQCNLQSAFHTVSASGLSPGPCYTHTHTHTHICRQCTTWLQCYFPIFHSGSHGRCANDGTQQLERRQSQTMFRIWIMECKYMEMTNCGGEAHVHAQMWNKLYGKRTQNKVCAPGRYIHTWLLHVSMTLWALICC